MELKGNTKWALVSEPLWFIPYTLFAPFATIFMYDLGLTSKEIGLIISIGFALQMVFALVGGIVTDKMGRRKATFIFDTIAWCIPCLLWTFSQNFWWFLVAAIINASQQITHTSWNCLYVEDCPPKLLTNAFTLLQICGMLAIFISPLSIIWVGEHGVVPVVRIIYFCSAISMGLKFIILYIFGSETEMGKTRLEETKNTSYFKLFLGYKSIFQKIIKSKKMLFVVFFIALFNITFITTNNFFSLYITQKLNVSDELLAVFPILRTLVMILFVIILQNLMNRLRMKRSLIVGFVIYIISHLVLIFAPEQSIFLISIYTILEASAFAIITPRKDAIMAFYVDIKERSRIYAIFNASMIALSSPFGIIVGVLFEKNPIYPFVFNILLFLVAIAMLFKFKAVGNFDLQVAE